MAISTELWPHQADALLALRHTVAQGVRRICVQSPTGSGKTKLAAAIVDGARSKGNRIAFVVPAIDLIDQTVESFYAEGLTDVGVIQADHQMTDWSKPIQVCSIQTIGRRGRPEASIVVVDECFVAGTIVDTPFGGKPIESVCVGDFVYNATGIGVVRHKFERRALSVVYLSLSNGEAILVTANHPLFTGRGWVKAGDLEVGSRLFSREAVRALRKSVQALGGGVARSARMPSGIGLEQANTLLNILLQESEQSNGGSRSPREDERYPAKDWAYADQTRRERKGERSAGCSLASAGEWMDFGIRGEDVKFWERIPDLLQDRHCQSGANGWDRSGREYALRKGKGTRQEENEFVGDVWVEDIARFERRGGAPVYNLEVSGHPSYFAGGVLAHNCHKLFQAQKDWITDPLCEKVIFIGLSATPWTKGLGKFYETLIVAETTQGLIEKGFLSRFKAFATGHPDLTGVKTVAGDYHEGQLSEAMQQGTLVADIIDTYKTRWGKGKTLVFGVDCTHAKCLQERFNQAGIPAGYQDAFTSMDERREIKRKFHNGDFQVVCNVGTLTTGVDWDVRCLVLARPTKSEMLYVQIIGRALRTNPEKEYALILDHSDTTSRLGLVTDIHHDQLDDGLPKQKAEKKKPLPKECKECGYLKPAGVGLCPNCGHQPKPPKNGRFEDDGELVEIDPAKAKRAVAKANGVADWTMGQKQTFFSELITFAEERGFKPGWAARKYKDRMGVWPNQLIKEPAAYVSGPTRKWLNEEYRRWKAQRDASFGAHPV